MVPNEVSGCRKPKRNVIRARIEATSQITTELESGGRVFDLTAKFSMAKSTICAILKNKIRHQSSKYITRSKSIS